MKLKAYKVPHWDDDKYYVPIKEEVIPGIQGGIFGGQQMDAIIVPGAKEAMAQGYAFEEFGDDRCELDLFVDEKIPKEEFREAARTFKRVKEGIFDTQYKRERTLADNIGRIKRTFIGIPFSHYWFFQYFLGPLLILTGMGNPLMTSVGAHMTVSRPYFVEKIREDYEEFFEKILDGIELTRKQIDRINQLEHAALKELRWIMENSGSRKDAYFEALHHCDELGVPDLKNVYRTATPLDEWKLREPGDKQSLAGYFPLYESNTEQFKKKINELRGKRIVRSKNLPNKIDSSIQIFDPKLLDASELLSLKKYSDLEEKCKQIAKDIGFEQIPLYETYRGKTLWAYKIGDGKENHFFQAITHGTEPASAPAVVKLIESYGSRGKKVDDVLSKTTQHFVPCSDPEGYDMRSRGAVDLYGEEQHEPPQQWLFRDPNGVWGDNTKSPRIMAIQDWLEEEVRPAIAVDFHETPTPIVFKGAGIMSIEDFWIPEKDRKKIEYLRKKPTLGVVEVTRAFGRKRTKKIMERNPAFTYGKSALDNVRKNGYEIFGGDYQRLEDKIPPIIPPQLLGFDEGRYFDGPLLWDNDIRVCSAWCHQKFDTIAMTTETFPNFLDERVAQDCYYAEGLILESQDLYKKKSSGLRGKFPF